MPGQVVVEELARLRVVVEPPPHGARSRRPAPRGCPAPRRRGSSIDDARDRPEDPAQRGLEQVGLAGEVVVDGGRGDAGLPRDIVDARVAEPLTGEHLDGRVDDDTATRRPVRCSVRGLSAHRPCSLGAGTANATRSVGGIGDQATAAPPVAAVRRDRRGDGSVRPPPAGERHRRRHRRRRRHDGSRRLLPLPLEGARAARGSADLHRPVPGDDPRARPC